MSRPAWRVAKAFAVLLVTVLALVAGVQSSRAADLELWVVFHENHTITVSLADGTPVGTLSGTGTAIPPGSYTFHIEDAVGVEGPEFDLRGPGVALKDDLYYGEAPSATHRVTLLPSSTYTWRNNEQPNIVFSFTTSAAAPSGGTSGGSSGSSGGSTSGGSSSTKTSTSQSKDVVGSTIVPFRGTLGGDVSTAGKLSLIFKGKKVSTLKTGRYKVSVLDETSKAAFVLQRLGKQAVKVSGAKFVGKRSKTLELKPGQWYFYSTPGKKSYFIVVN